MSFGALILKQDGDYKSNKFSSMPTDLSCAITEIRVEQHLYERSTFGIRFQEDFEGDEAKTITAEEVRGGAGIAILVPKPTDSPNPSGIGPASLGLDDMVCLLRGQIENAEVSVARGASGSWVEVRGRDVRTIIDRSSRWQSLSGDTTQIAEILSAPFTDKFTGGAPVASYEGKDSWTVQGTALESLERLSKLIAYPVRLSWDVETSFSMRRDEPPIVFTVTTNTSFAPSPSRAQDEDNVGVTALELLTGPGEVKADLLIIGDDEQCENVIDFSTSVDNEATAHVDAAWMDGTTGEPGDIENLRSPDTPGNEGETVEVTGVEADTEADTEDGARKAVITKVGGGDIVAAAATAAAIEESWYVKATAMTTVHMLGEILQPHDIVNVEGGGCGVSGLMQVEKVTHVINASAHWMHLELRGNSRMLVTPKAGILDD